MQCKTNHSRRIKLTLVPSQHVRLHSLHEFLYVEAYVCIVDGFASARCLLPDSTVPISKREVVVEFLWCDDVQDRKQMNDFHTRRTRDQESHWNRLADAFDIHSHDGSRIT